MPYKYAGTVIIDGVSVEVEIIDGVAADGVDDPSYEYLCYLAVASLKDETMLEVVYKRMCLGTPDNWVKDGAEVRHKTARASTKRIASLIKASDGFWKNNRARSRSNTGAASALDTFARDMFLPSLATPHIQQKFTVAALITDPDAPIQRIHVFYPFANVSSVYSAASALLTALDAV